MNKQLSGCPHIIINIHVIRHRKSFPVKYRMVPKNNSENMAMISQRIEDKKIIGKNPYSQQVMDVFLKGEDLFLIAA